MTEIPELTAEAFARAIPASTRKRLMLGRFDSGEDIAALRRFVGLTQTQFALAMSISVHTLRNWEQSRRHPEGPAITLLRIAARHPRIFRENLEIVDELQPEYTRSDFGELVRVKYAARLAAETNVVVLEPEVARAFPNAGAVNEALRSLIRIAEATARVPARRAKAAG